MGGEALEHNRRGFFKADFVGQRPDPRGGRKRVGGVAAGGEYESDAVADGDVGDVGADRFHDAGAFKSEGQSRSRL